MGNWSDFWSYFTKLWLVRNYVVWVFPAGGTVIGYAVYLWSTFWHLLPPERFVLVLASGTLSTVFLFCCDYLRRPKVNGLLTPVTMNSTEARLMFKNKGRRASFFVKCEFTGQIHIPNTLPNVVYDPAWENQTVKMLSLAEGDSAHLILASWKLEDIVNNYYGRDEKCTLGIAEFRALGKEEPEHRMVWHSELKAHLPACDIKVTVLSDGGRGTLERFFTIEPQYLHGPLHISEYVPSGKDGKRVRP